MPTLNAAEIRNALTGRLEDVVEHLFPNGKKQGGAYRVGSLEGEPGKSLSVCLSGSKRGLWMDGATGDSGNPIDLWIGARGHASYREARNEMIEFTGLKEHRDTARTKLVEPKAERPRALRAHDVIAPLSPQVIAFMDDRGIEMRTLSAYGVGAHPDDPTVVAYPYFIPNGSVYDLVKVKYTAIGRDKKGKKLIWSTKGQCSPLWGLPVTRPVAWGERNLVLTEGEIDAMSYYQHGALAYSVPDGATGHSKWLTESFEQLLNYESIYVSFDMDAAGRKGLEEVVPRLGRERVSIVTLKDAKDANECHVKGGDLIGALDDAKADDPDDMVFAAALVGAAWDRLRHGKREEQGIVPLDLPVEEFPFRYRPAETTIYTGYNGSGKSNFLYQVVAWLTCVKGERVFLGSYEEPCDDILGVMATQANGKPFGPDDLPRFTEVTDKFSGNLIMHHTIGCIDHDMFFDYANYAARRHGCTHVILDSLSTTDVGMDDNPAQKVFIAKANEFARATGAHVHIVAHPRKPSTIPGKKLANASKFDVRGSGVLTDLAFNVISVFRPDGTWIGGPDCQIIVCKQKVGGKVPIIDLNFDEDSYRIYHNYNDGVVPYA